MKHIKNIILEYPFLKNLESTSIVYNTKADASLASSIVKSNVPYKPGVYLIYELKENDIGELLYVGKAGADKNGKINNHQIPKRLLATINLKEKYKHHPEVANRKELTRDKAFPIMMKIDNILAIKIFCFFSKISDDFEVEKESNPLALERIINKSLKTRPLKWAK